MGRAALRGKRAEGEEPSANYPSSQLVDPRRAQQLPKVSAIVWRAAVNEDNRRAGLDVGAGQAERKAGNSARDIAGKLLFLVIVIPSVCEIGRGADPARLSRSERRPCRHGGFRKQLSCFCVACTLSWSDAGQREPLTRHSAPVIPNPERGSANPAASWSSAVRASADHAVVCAVLSRSRTWTRSFPCPPAARRLLKTDHLAT